MKKRKLAVCVIILCLLFITGCVKKEWIQNIVVNDSSDKNYNKTMKQDLLCLMMAYPEHISDIEKAKDSRVFLVMKSGLKILYDDKRTKSYQERLSNPDLQDMMEHIYPLSNIDKLMDKDFDPGRIRVYSLLKEVYGKSKNEAQSKLVNVNIGYKNYPFNTSNGAANKLKSAIKEVTLLAQNQLCI